MGGVGSTLKEQQLERNVERFRGGLVFKVYRLLRRSTLGSRVIKKRRRWSTVQGFSRLGVSGPRLTGCIESAFLRTSWPTWSVDTGGLDGDPKESMAYLQILSTEGRGTRRNHKLKDLKECGPLAEGAHVNGRHLAILFIKASLSLGIMGCEDRVVRKRKGETRVRSSGRGNPTQHAMVEES